MAWEEKIKDWGSTTKSWPVDRPERRGGFHLENIDCALEKRSQEQATINSFSGFFFHFGMHQLT